MTFPESAIDDGRGNNFTQQKEQKNANREKLTLGGKEQLPKT